jgi:hypothetical protein
LVARGATIGRREVERGHKRRNLERNVLLWEFLQAQQQQQQLDSSQ